MTDQPLAPHLEQGPAPEPHVAKLVYDAFARHDIDVAGRGPLVQDVIRAVRICSDERPVAVLPRNLSLTDAHTVVSALGDIEWLVLRGNPDGTIGIWANQ